MCQHLSRPGHQAILFAPFKHDMRVKDGNVWQCRRNRNPLVGRFPLRINAVGPLTRPCRSSIRDWAVTNPISGIVLIYHRQSLWPRRTADYHRRQTSYHSCRKMVPPPVPSQRAATALQTASFSFRCLAHHVPARFVQIHARNRQRHRYLTITAGIVFNRRDDGNSGEFSHNPVIPS